MVFVVVQEPCWNVAVRIFLQAIVIAMETKKTPSVCAADPVLQMQTATVSVTMSTPVSAQWTPVASAMALAPFTLAVVPIFPVETVIAMAT